MISRFLLKQRKSLAYLTSSRFSELKDFQSSFLSTANIAYIEGLYSQWKEDKASVSPSFGAYFEELEKGGDPEASYMQAPKPGT